MREVIKTLGKHIAYETTAKTITFGDEDLSINLKNRERDDAVMIDVCSDINGELTMGTALGNRYVAQVEIPARQYNYEEQENPSKGEPGEPDTILVPVPVPFDIEKCTIYLYGMEE